MSGPENVLLRWPEATMEGAAKHRVCQVEFSKSPRMQAPETWHTTVAQTHLCSGNRGASVPWVKLPVKTLTWEQVHTLTRTQRVDLFFF